MVNVTTLDTLARNTTRRSAGGGKMEESPLLNTHNKDLEIIHCYGFTVFHLKYWRTAVLHPADNSYIDRDMIITSYLPTTSHDTENSFNYQKSK